MTEFDDLIQIGEEFVERLSQSVGIPIDNDVYLAWKNNCKQLLEKRFGKDSHELNQYVSGTHNLKKYHSDNFKPEDSPKYYAIETQQIITYLKMFKSKDSDLDKKIMYESTESANLFQSGDKIRILFLAANPKDIVKLELDKEYKSLRDTLQKSEYRDQFDLQQEYAVSVGELQGLLLRFRPTIVHFSGHGADNGVLIFENHNGEAEIVPPDSLTNLFGIINNASSLPDAMQHRIRCVVLNACYSLAQAKAIATYVDCVIGISDAIKDKNATIFSASFYQALGFGRSVKTAFDLGCNQLGLYGEPDEKILKLEHRSQLDPSKVCLTKRE